MEEFQNFKLKNFKSDIWRFAIYQAAKKRTRIREAVFSETTKMNTNFVGAILASVQMKLFLVKLNFLTIKSQLKSQNHINLYHMKFKMAGEQQQNYQYLFTPPPPRCPRRSPRTTRRTRPDSPIPPCRDCQHLLY